jgi:oxygen-independent coproporphyrinogen-3 oxidase
MKSRQEQIPSSSLPGPYERFLQADIAAETLMERGYVRVGLDHFARPDDRLAAISGQGRVARNFQGYTTDDNPVLLGIGVSSIGRLPQGYIQNATEISVYRDRLREGRLPTKRGIRFSGDDRLRGAVIERLMCDLAVDLDSVAAHFDRSPDSFAPELARLEPLIADGIARRTGSRIEITEEGRPLLRAVAALFDSYLAAPTAGAAPPRHSSVV